MSSLQTICTLVDYHINDIGKADRSWRICDSDLSGRGIFAVRDIQPGEVIFREKPLLIGPTTGRDSKLNICTICCKVLDEIKCVCSQGCSLPICSLCAVCDQHLNECNLYQSWEPIERTTVDRHSLRAITIARGLLLNETQRALIDELQANAEPHYRKEINNAANCFRKFPTDKKTLDYFYKIVCVLNTNAFEAIHQKDNVDTRLRGLYPLTGIMNHQCTPNTCHSFEDDNDIIVKSTKFIPKGDELTTTYSRILWSSLSRKIFLNMTKQFTCSCSRCLDPTENGSYLSALLCRTDNCVGWIIPKSSDVMKCDWTCIKCGATYDSKYVGKMQDFLLRIINGKSSTSSIKEILEFIREKIHRLCPPTNQLVIELKLHVIWKMSKSGEKFSENDLSDKIQYCQDILNILEKLKAGECTMKFLLLDEMEKANVMLQKIKLM